VAVVAAPYGSEAVLEVLEGSPTAAVAVGASSAWATPATRRKKKKRKGEKREVGVDTQSTASRAKLATSLARSYRR